MIVKSLSVDSACLNDLTDRDFGKRFILHRAFQRGGEHFFVLSETASYGTKSATPEQIAVKAHERKRQSGSVTDIVPEGTPTEVVEHRLSNAERICASCGTVMEEIGKEVHRSLQMEPARF